MKLRTGATLALSLTVLAACSGGSTKPSETEKGRAFVDVVAKAAVDGFTDSDLPSETECFAVGLVDTLGVEVFETAGIDPDASYSSQELLDALAMDAATADRAADATIGCFDLAAAIGQDADVELTETERTCVNDGLLAMESYRLVYTAGLRSSEDRDATMEEAFQMTLDFFEVLEQCGLDSEAIMGFSPDDLDPSAIHDDIVDSTEAEIAQLEVDMLWRSYQAEAALGGDPDTLAGYTEQARVFCPEVDFAVGDFTC